MSVALTLADLHVRTLSHSLHGWGWECLQADLDLVAGKARIVLRSYTGRVVTLDADGLGRVSITREQAESTTVLVGRRGDRFRAERETHVFLGRARYDGIPSALRGLADYVADNAGIGRQIARAPFATLLTDETRHEP